MDDDAVAGGVGIPPENWEEGTPSVRSIVREEARANEETRSLEEDVRGSGEKVWDERIVSVWLFLRFVRLEFGAFLDLVFLMNVSFVVF